MPVILVLLVVVTGVVLFSVRRATVDERLVGALRDAGATAGAADAALRYCENWIWVAPPGIPTPAGSGLPNPPKSIMAPAATATTPAWRDSANWTDTERFVTVPADAIGKGMGTARCLIEDATAELAAPAAGQFRGGGEEAQFVGGVLAGTPPANWRKYRITAEVVSGGPGPTRTARVQSEVRLQ